MIPTPASPAETVVREWSYAGERVDAYRLGANGCLLATDLAIAEHNALCRAYLAAKAQVAEKEAELRGAGHEGIATLQRLLTDERARATASEASRAAMREALVLVRAIITEAALTGFNCHDGDWATKLFESQGVTHDALSAGAQPGEEK